MLILIKKCIYLLEQKVLSTKDLFQSENFGLFPGQISDYEFANDHELFERVRGDHPLDNNGYKLQMKLDDKDSLRLNYVQTFDGVSVDIELIHGGKRISNCCYNDAPSYYMRSGYTPETTVEWRGIHLYSENVKPSPRPSMYTTCYSNHPGWISLANLIQNCHTITSNMKTINL